jgi:hypothetical protein
MLEMMAAFAPDAARVKSVEAWIRSPRMEILKISPELQSSTDIKKINVQTVEQQSEIGLGEILCYEHSSDFRVLVISLNLTNEV